MIDITNANAKKNKSKMQDAPQQDSHQQEDIIMEAEPAPAAEKQQQQQQQQAIADHQSDSSSESPDIVPDNHSVAAAPPAAQTQQRGSVSWAPMDQELALKKLDEQKRLLKRQNRAIKFLKNEVAGLKRKLQEMQAAQNAHPNFHQQQQMMMMDEQPHMDTVSVNNNNNNYHHHDTMDRRTSAGEIPPGKKMRISMDDGSASASFQSDASHENDPIPYEVQPSPTAARLYLTQQEEQEQTPNTFKVRNQPIVDPYGDSGTYSGSISS